MYLRACTGCLLAVSCFGAQQLTVKSATAHRVELAWTGSSPAWQVERRAGSGEFQKLAESNGAGYTDGSIQAFTTYHYRVRSQAGMVSNEVVVGPPPAGVSLPAPVPKGVDAANYGVSTEIASDENGDPAIAFIWNDVNGDNDYSDDTLCFVHWNRATYSWKPVVKVAVVGNISTGNLDPVSVACDRATGTIALSFPVDGAKGIQVALSHDGGASWQLTPMAADIEGVVASTGIAAANGRWMLAFMSDEAGVRYFSGPAAAAPGDWKAQPTPAPENASFVSSANLALAADSDGHPLVAYWVQPNEGDNYHVLIWRPDSGKVTTAADSNNQRPDPPNLRLVSAAGKTHLLLNSVRDENDSDYSVWYAESSPAGWTQPVKPPIDGPRSTNSPLGLAVDSHGQIAAVFDANSGGGDTACGYPVVSLSTDGTHWKTCGIGKPTGGAFDPQSSSINAQYGPDDRLNIVWHQEGENKYGTGVLLWRQ